MGSPATPESARGTRAGVRTRKLVYAQHPALTALQMVRLLHS